MEFQKLRDRAHEDVDGKRGTRLWSRGLLRVLTGSLLAVVFLIAAACGDVDIDLGSDDDAPVETRDASFAVGSSSKLVVDTFNGAVTVIAGPEGTIRVQATLKRADKLDYEADQSGDTVRVKAEKHSGINLRNSGATVEITAPPSTTVELKTSNGSIEVRGLQGSGVLRTSNGKVVVQDFTGGLEASSSNGGIEVTGLKGSVDLETSNGSISFSGELTPGSRNDLKTSNAGVTAQLEGTPSVTLDASTSNGKVTSDLPVQMDSAGDTKLTGTIGDGEAELKIRTSNGSITIR
jgi:DUF4097 and DUF4098 domain-containing protein YvlB